MRLEGVEVIRRGVPFNVAMQDVRPLSVIKV